MKKRDFVMSTENLNCYGFWTQTEGIDITDFLKNPVGYYNHESEDLPPIKWENIRKEGGQLLGTAVFDEKDEFAMQIWDKVENGFINGASIGFRVIETSNDPALLKQGQKNATVVKCKLVECSIVNNPGNTEALAVRLYGEKAEVILSGDGVNNVVPKLQANMFEKLTTLGYKDADAVLGEIAKLKGERDALNTEIASLKAEQQKANEAQIRALCDKKGLGKNETEAFVSLANANMANTLIALEAMQDYTPASQQIAGAQGGARQSETLLGKLKANPEKTYEDWASTKEGAKFLEKLEAEMPDEFEKLYQKSYSK